ncbi:MAG TPA: AI-2E family transporter [Candidatus Scatomonas pullistercoris]|uniref:AI-2E family transporter n=1 Tax=Candidatus Scatomonas pullistercoris TaxID=2840920 RepID=A0A9D1T9P5_9FIRM|nr:AI-2E family transporter [Candidatus Scatomonas pullistercoris]
MKFRPDKKYLYWGLTLFLALAASILFYFVIFHMDSLRRGFNLIISILMPLIIGLLIAYVMWPLVRLIETKLFLKLLQKLKIQYARKGEKAIRLASILISLFLFIFAIYLLLALLIPQLFNSIVSIVENFPRYIDNIQEWISSFFQNNPEMEDTINNLIANFSSRAEGWMNQDLLPQLNNLLRNLSSGLLGVINFLKNFILGIIVSIYVLYSKESLIANAKKGLYAVCRTKRANQIIRDCQYIDATFGKYIIGMTLDSLNIAVWCYIGLLILGMPYALLISVVVGATNFIPFFGPYLGAIPSAVLIFMVNPIQALYFVIFIFVLQQIDGNFIAPRILGDSTGMSSLMVLIAIMIFGGLFGIPGMLIGVPLFAVICTIVRHFIESRLESRKLPKEQEFYKGLDHIDEESHEAVRTNRGREIRKEEAFTFRRSGGKQEEDTDTKPKK